jgi:NitT/TauT family transport system substrate-binding protein
VANPRMHATTGLVVALALGLAACGGGSGASTGTAGGGGSASAQPVTLSLDFAIDGLHAPFFVALQKGYYRQAGLDVTIQPGQGSAPTVQITGAGRSQFGIADAGVVADAVSKGAGVTAVAALLQHMPGVTIALKTSGIAKPGDLAGKSIGDGAQGSTATLLPAFLNANHVDPASVKFVGMTYPARVPSLLSGQVNAIGGYVQEFVSVLDKVNVIRWYQNGVESYGSTIIVNNDFKRNHPDLVKAFLSASLKGLDYTVKNPADAASIVAAASHGDVTYFSGELALLDPYFTSPDVDTHGYGWMNDAIWNATQGLNVKYGTQPQPVDAASLYTDAFLPQK